MVTVIHPFQLASLVLVLLVFLAAANHLHMLVIAVAQLLVFLVVAQAVQQYPHQVLHRLLLTALVHQVYHLLKPVMLV